MIARTLRKWRRCVRIRAVGSARLGGGEPLQGLSTHAEGAPIAHFPGAQLQIQADGQAVPGESGPLQARAAARQCEIGQIPQQGRANAAFPERGINEQILQVDSRLSQKGRVIVEEQRKTGGPPIASAGEARIM